VYFLSEKLNPEILLQFLIIDHPVAAKALYRLPPPSLSLLAPPLYLLLL